MGEIIDNLIHKQFDPNFDESHEDFEEKLNKELNDALENTDPYLKKQKYDMRRVALLFKKAKAENNKPQIAHLRERIKDYERQRGLAVLLLEEDIEFNEAHEDIMNDPNDSLLEAIIEDRI